MSETPTPKVETNRFAIAHELAAILSDLETEPLRKHFDEEVIMDFPFATAPMPRRLTGVDEVVLGMKAMPAMFSKFKYEPSRLYEAPGSNVLIMEAESRGTLLDGSDYSNRYVTILRFNGPRVILWREYYDPLRLPDMSVGG